MESHHSLLPKIIGKLKNKISVKQV